MNHSLAAFHCVTDFIYCISMLLYKIRCVRFLHFPYLMLSVERPEVSLPTPTCKWTCQSHECIHLGFCCCFILICMCILCPYLNSPLLRVTITLNVASEHSWVSYFVFKDLFIGKLSEPKETVISVLLKVSLLERSTTAKTQTGLISTVGKWKYVFFRRLSVIMI